MLFDFKALYLRMLDLRDTHEDCLYRKELMKVINKDDSDAANLMADYTLYLLRTGYPREEMDYIRNTIFVDGIAICRIMGASRISTNVEMCNLPTQNPFAIEAAKKINGRMNSASKKSVEDLLKEFIDFLQVRKMSSFAFSDYVRMEAFMGACRKAVPKFASLDKDRQYAIVKEVGMKCGSDHDKRAFTNNFAIMIQGMPTMEKGHTVDETININYDKMGIKQFKLVKGEKRYPNFSIYQYGDGIYRESFSPYQVGDAIQSFLSTFSADDADEIQDTSL